MNHKRFTFVCLFQILILSPFAYGQFCNKWEEPRQIGQLPVKTLKGASGLTASRQFANRLYWINDHGDRGLLQMSTADGKNFRAFVVKDLKRKDSEAMTTAECPEGPCLIIGDIGDNFRRRKDLTLFFILEQEKWHEPIPLLRRMRIEYPDGAHDAEAMGVLPNGDLIIVTKEITLLQLRADAAGVYTLPKNELHAPGDGKVHRLRKLGSLPIPKWLDSDGFLGHAVTDLAINPHRPVMGLLTYHYALEIPLDRLKDLSRVDEWKIDVDFATVKLKSLGQQETLTYLKERDEMVWSTEYIRPDSPLYAITCTPR